MRFTHGILTLALAATTACGNDTGPKPVDLTGRWQGELGGAVLTMNLAQEGTQLLGSGSLGPDEPFSVTGTFIDPQVSLSINRAPYTGITLTGQQEDGRRIAALANGYMLNNVPIVLLRQ